MFSMESLDCPARVYASDRYYIMKWLDGFFWNIQGAGLVCGNNRVGSASRMSAKSEPPKADAEWTPSGVRADL